jgi:hypothetical protein
MCLYHTLKRTIMMQVGKPLTGKEFIGRQKEAREIIQYLSMGQSVVLIAPRRFGKPPLTDI